MKGGQRKIVALGDCRGKGPQCRFRLALRNDPGGNRERRIIAQHRPVDQRLPDRLLTSGERRRARRSIADEVGSGVIGGLPDDRVAVRRNPIDAWSRRAASVAWLPGGFRVAGHSILPRSPPPALRSARPARACPAS